MIDIDSLTEDDVGRWVTYRKGPRVNSAATFGSLEIFSDPAESEKFWGSDVGRSIIRYFYLILVVAGHLYEQRPAGARDQKIQKLIGLLAKQYQDFRLHEISPQFESTPEPNR
jgi:hypothetical protein